MDTRARIVETSTGLFSHYGYAATGLKQISAQANAPFGSIYHFFPGGKAELAAEAVRTSGATYQQLVMDLLRADEDPVSAVRAVFVGAAGVLLSTDFKDACPIATVALEVASTNETLRIATAEVFQDWVAAGAEFFSGLGLPPSQARGLATVVIELLEGAFLLSRAWRNVAAMEAAANAATALVSAALEAVR